MEPEDVSIFGCRNEAGARRDDVCKKKKKKISYACENVKKRGSICSLASCLNLKFSTATLHQRGKGPFRCLHTAAAAAAAAPLTRLLSPSPTHFVARVTLTLNSQVGRCRGRDAEAVARTAGVFPGILRLDPEDDEGAVNEDAHSELQVTAERCRRSVRQADQHDGAVISLSLSPFSFFSLSCRHEILKGAMWEQQRVKPRPSWDPENTESRARDSNTSVNCHFVDMVQPLIHNHSTNNNMTLCTSF